jgi:hypothetical protein
MFFFLRQRVKCDCIYIVMDCVHAAAPAKSQSFGALDKTNAFVLRFLEKLSASRSNKTREKWRKNGVSTIDATIFAQNDSFCFG